MRIQLSVSVLALLMCFSAGPTTRVLADDPVIRLRQDDAEMETAKRKARESLSQFWAKFRNPSSNEERFSLKVAMPYENNAEHIWVTNIEREGGKIRATVSNEPKYVKYVRIGQRIEFEDDQISNWMYRRDGKIVGNFTMRPLLARMPPADAERYRAMLAEP